MRLRKFEACVQAVLLVMSVVSFSYLMGGVLGLASAQSDETGYTLQDILDAGGYDSASEYNQDTEEAEETGFVSEALLAVMEFFNQIIPQIHQLSGAQVLEELLDSSGGGVYRCPETHDGQICLGFLAKDCDARCSEECIRVDISRFDLPSDSPCALGICFDPVEGICSPRSTKQKCEDDGGQWFKETDNEVQELCSRGCCMFGSQTDWTTETRCKKIIEGVGGDLTLDAFQFNAEIQDAIACSGLSDAVQEGACVFSNFDDPDGQNPCEFTDMSDCISSGGSFHPETLCSHPDLNTLCERQVSTNCVEGKDEVYWFDSCGNRENIFEGKGSSERDLSWNDGMVKAKSESCQIGTVSEPTKNQENCGNCNRYRSSYCGNETTEGIIQELDDDPDGGVVCLDMSCVDESGNHRMHGESWCAYQSSIGLPGNDLMNPGAFISFMPDNPLSSMLGGGESAHSTDTPGSRHFRKYCQDGVIHTSQCDDYRNQVCVEQQTPIVDEVDPEKIITDFDTFLAGLVSLAGGETFSQASCRMNRWQECLAYNPDQMEGRMIGMADENAGTILKTKLDLTCGMDPDCFVKHFKLDKYDISYCAPRYPPGFDSVDNPDAMGGLCSQASNKCTAVFVKELFKGWTCKSNCECVEGDDPDSAEASQDFVKRMNELCVSVGDCGYQVNYKGDMPGGKGYKVSVASCDVSDDECGQSQMPSMEDITGGLGLDFGLGGFMEGADSFGGDANPTPGEFIQARGGFMGENLGESIKGFLEDLGFDNLFKMFGGGGNGYSAGGNSDFGSGISTAGGVLGLGAYGASYVAGGFGTGSAALEGTWYTVSFAEPLAEPIGLTVEGVHSTLEVGTTSIATQDPQLAVSLSGMESGSTISSSASASTSSALPALEAFGGAALGAAGGAALTTFLMDVLGIGPGLDPTTAGVLNGAGAVGGGMVGYGLTSSGATATIGGPVSAGTTLGGGTTLTAGSAVGTTAEGATITVSAGGTVPPGAVVTAETGTVVAEGGTQVFAGAGGSGLSPVATAGIVVLVAVVVIMIIFKLLGIGEQKKVEVTFECQPWVPPKFGDCEGCGTNDQLSDGSSSYPCSKYSCQATGQNCEFVQGSEVPEEGGICVSVSDFDVAAPVIVNKYFLNPGYEFVDVEDHKFRIESEEGEGCIGEFDPVLFGFELDEYAYCGISAVVPTDIDAMLSLGGLARNQTYSFVSTELDELGYEENLVIEERNDIELYVVCKDYPHENNNLDRPYVFEMCVVPGDLQAPLIVGLPSEILVPFEATERIVSIPLFESAECRWSFGDMPFDQMSPSTQCVTDENPLTGNYFCSISVPIDSDTEDIFVRCKDHPEWEGTERESERNENQEGVEVEIVRSSSRLGLSILSPLNDEVIKVAGGPAKVDVEVQTSGGAYDGEAECYYNIDVTGDVPFAETGERDLHTQELNQVSAGGHRLLVRCNDGVNPEASADVFFTVEIDNSLPEITRVYDDNSRLIVQTSEPGECAYSLGLISGRSSACSFNVDEAGELGGVSLMSVMTGSEGLMHSTSFDESAIYYLKCKDVLGNEPIGCGMVVSGGSV